MNQQTCEQQRLDAYLRGELDLDEESDLISHLDSCEICRDSIEMRAGEAPAWQEATDMLTGWRLHRTIDSSDRTHDQEYDDETGTDFESNANHSIELRQVQEALAPTDDPSMLGRLGPYEISGIVGSGAMGVVLKAHDQSLDRIVAIKVLAPHLASSGSARKRFAREAKAAAAVLHSNVIAIHSVSNDASLPYLVMPYVRGESLQKRLDREGPLPISEVLRIGSQIAAGLAAAHAQGLVHRDIKPANILLEAGVERVAITDFGLARAVDDATMTRSGVIAGTPQYMSPEQARGETIDARSDLFSLGSVLYAMCTGRCPFRAETTFGVLQRINNEKPRAIHNINSDVPVWLSNIVDKLMSKHPDDRFESAELVAENLEDCLAHVQQPNNVLLPKSVSAITPKSKPVRKRIGVLTMIATSILALASLFGLGVVATSPVDIAGTWTGKDWGTVQLEPTNSGSYEGTYTDTFDGATGKIKLKWSRLERQFKGTWGQSKKRFGRISIRRVEDEIRGAWTTSKKSEIDSGVPRLSDLHWKKSEETPAVSIIDSPKLALSTFLKALRNRDHETFAAIIKDDPGLIWASVFFDSEAAVSQLHEAVVSEFGASGWENLSDRKHASIDGVCLAGVDEFEFDVRGNSAIAHRKSIRFVLEKDTDGGWRFDIKATLTQHAKSGMAPEKLLNVMKGISQVCQDFSTRVGDYSDVEMMDIAMGKELLKVIAGSGAKPRIRVNLNGLTWDPVAGRLRSSQNKKAGTKDSPSSGQSASSQNEKQGVNTTVGSTQIQATIKRHNLRKVNVRDYSFEWHNEFSQQLCFDGKAGRVTTVQSTNRIFALPKPIELIQFDIVVANKQDGKVGQKSTFYENADEPFDYIHVSWTDKEECIVTFFTSQPVDTASKAKRAKNSENSKGKASNPQAKIMLRGTIKSTTVKAGWPVPHTRQAPLMRVRSKRSLISSMKPGQTGEVRIDAFPNEQYKGTVTAVITPPNQPDRVEVIVSLVTWPKSLKEELTGSIELALDQEDDAG